MPTKSNAVEGCMWMWIYKHKNKIHPIFYLTYILERKDSNVCVIPECNEDIL